MIKFLLSNKTEPGLDCCKCHVIREQNRQIGGFGQAVPHAYKICNTQHFPLCYTPWRRGIQYLKQAFKKLRKSISEALKNDSAAVILKEQSD